MLEISPNDASLLIRAKRNDKKAFETIVKRHQRGVYSLALRMLGNPQEAEDVLQETFIAFHGNIGQFRGQAKLSTYLFRMATNFSLMRLRYLKRHGGYNTANLSEAAEEPSRTRSPLETLLNRELNERMERLLARLPDKDRAVVVLRDVQGVAGLEVARILKLSLPAMKSRLHRSREFLRKELLPYVKQ